MIARMSERDPYAVLGLQRGASAEEIKRAYRRLARRHHPDLNPGDAASEERFKELTAAYELLSDPKRLSEYERGRLSWREVLERIDPAKLRLETVLADLFGGRREEPGPQETTATVVLPARAAEGGATVAATIGGVRRRFRVPPGCKDGTRLRLDDGALVVLRLR